jgi:UDP-N-acetylmuramate--alanine ligase
MEEFARSFNNADTLFVTDIYAASEDPIEGTTAEVLTAAIKRFGHKDVRYVGALENAPTALRDHVQPGDLVLTLGAGTVSRVSDQLLELLRGRGDATAVQV